MIPRSRGIFSCPRIFHSTSLFPFPIRELLAQSHLLELSNARPWNRFHKHKRVRQLPFRKRLRKKHAKFLPGRLRHFGCGTPTTAASFTAGCAISAFSRSTELIHSPPDFTRSFARSTNFK